MNQIERKMAVIKLDSVTFRLKEHQDFHWLNKYGKAFWCVDETGSGCICIGMEDAVLLQNRRGKYNRGGNRTGRVCNCPEKRGVALPRIRTPQSDPACGRIRV